jgi:hypothetical protein
VVISWRAAPSPLPAEASFNPVKPVTMSRPCWANIIGMRGKDEQGIRKHRVEF